MSLLVASIEYMLMATIFESIRQSDENHLNERALKTQRRKEILNTWNPLSTNEWNNIKKLTGGHMR